MSLSSANLHQILDVSQRAPPDHRLPQLTKPANSTSISLVASTEVSEPTPAGDRLPPVWVQTTRFHQAHVALKESDMIITSSTTASSRVEAANRVQAVSTEGKDDATPLWLELFDRPPIAVRFEPKIFSLCKTYSLPASLLPRIFSFLAEVPTLQSYHTQNYYTSLVELVQLHGCSSDVEIQKDVSRTFPHLLLFQNQEGQHRLYKLLACYCVRSPTVGYCQGLNNIAGVLLTFLDDESAFWVFCRLVEERIGYFTPTMSMLEVDYRMFSALLSWSDPLLSDHFAAHNITPSSFIVSWFLCLLIEAPLSLPDALQVWALMLVGGDCVLFQVALVLLRSKREEFLKMQSQTEILDFILNGKLALDTNITTLLQSIDSDLRFEKQVRFSQAFYRSIVIKSHRRLHSGIARRLQQLCGFTTEDEVQTIWQAFVQVNPWQVLIYSAIQSLPEFVEAILPLAFSPSVRAIWRGDGLFSGALERLFTIFDTGHGKVPFPQFLYGVYAFRYSTVERFHICFRFFNFHDRTALSRDDFARGFGLLKSLYAGGTPESHLSDSLEVTESMLVRFQSLRNNSKSTESSLDTNEFMLRQRDRLRSPSRDSESVSEKSDSSIRPKKADVSLSASRLNTASKGSGNVIEAERVVKASLSISLPAAMTSLFSSSPDDSPAELSERDSEDLDISISSTNSSKAPEDKSALFDGTSNIITAESFDSSYQTRQTLTPPEQDALAPTMLNFEQFCDFIVQNELARHFFNLQGHSSDSKGASIKSSLFPVDAQAGQIKKQTQKNDSKVADQSSSEHLFDKLLSLSWF